MKKIGFMGAHSSAKTTTVNRMATAMSDLGIPVVKVKEVARDCPYDFNEGGGAKSQMWMLQEQARREISAEQELEDAQMEYNKYSVPEPVIICDRSIWDYLAYSQSLNEAGKISDEDVKIIREAVVRWANVLKYDELYFCEPKPLYEDGVRSTDESWRENVVVWFKRMIKQEGIPVKIIQ